MVKRWSLHTGTRNQGIGLCSTANLALNDLVASGLALTPKDIDMKWFWYCMESFGEGDGRESVDRWRCLNHGHGIGRERRNECVEVCTLQPTACE